MLYKRNIWILVVLSSFMLFLILSCSQESSSTDKIKPVKVESEKSAVESVEINPDKPIQSETDGVRREPRQDLPDIEIRRENLLMSTRTGYIMQGIMFYRDAHGRFPDSIDDMINEGWYLFWPINIHTNQPVKILNKPPDETNLDDFGHVFYEKFDDDHAEFHQITIDPHRSTDSDIIWVSRQAEINYEEKANLINPDSPRFEKHRMMLNQPAEERVKYYYTTFQFRSMNNFFNVAMQIGNTLDESLIDVMKLVNYKTFPQGYDYFSQAVEKGWFSFDVGTIEDIDMNYFDFSDGDEIQIVSCWKLMPDLGTMGLVEKRAECPENRNNFRSVFNSKDLGKFKFPDDMLINAEEIR